MPEVVSAVGLCVGYAAMHLLARGTSAVSPEAEALCKAAGEVIRAAERSQALFGDKAAAISAIQALAYNCSGAGWDGGQAEPVSPVASRISADFIRALPASHPLPEFAAEPDGAIS